MTYQYRKDHIPTNTPYNRRPRNFMNPTTITIHNTGNQKSSAANERAWLTNPDNKREASFHIVVDQVEAIECLPLSENAWHAGDGSKTGSGNRSSIGVEICESGNYSKTLQNAVVLVASMLRERGWGVERLRRHYDWSKKICPRLMYDEGKWTGWTQFKNRVADELADTKEEEPMTVQEKQAFEALEKKVKEQAATIKELKDKQDIPAPSWAKEAAAYYEKYLDTKTGSHDFWRALTIQYRKEKGITV